MIGTSSMDSKKVFITGSGGFVGKYLYAALKPGCKVFGIDKVKNNFVDDVFDICDEMRLRDALNAFKPNVIIHLAALSNVELCEKDRELAYRNNVSPVQILTDWVKGNNARLIFISTDYVYDGIKGDFTEEDAENPVQWYGETKLEAEKIVAALKNFVILRPTVIYGWDPNGMNFFMQLYRSWLAEKEMRVPADQISNPIYVADLCNLIEKIIRTEDSSGKYNATGPESFNRYDFAVKICEYFNWDKSVLIPLKTADLGQVARRPLNNSTISDKVSERFGFRFKTLECNLSFIKEQIK